MSPTSPIIIIVSLLVALLTTKLVSVWFKIQLKPVKYISIDGLRGYLAFFVFLHHSSVYCFFLPTWNWAAPPSNLFTHFGQTSVSLFFMVTGFLFFSKLIEAREKKIDWLHFFVSRFLRLYPLYIFVLAAVFFIAFFMTDLKFLEPMSKILSEAKHWFLFAMYDNPNINTYSETNGIMASVIWSIKYEWLFYFSLPVLGLIFFKQRPAIITLLLSCFIVFSFFYFTYIKVFHFYSFLGGLIAAILAKNDVFLKLSKHFLSSLIIITCLFLAVCFFETAYLVTPLILTSIAFILIAGGNTIFGILSINVSRQIGQLSYSIYLLHTTLLFIIYRMIIGIDVAGKYSVEKFWAINMCLAVVLILLSFATYYFIELPSINSSGKVTKKIYNLKARFVKTVKPTRTSSQDGI
ncbi:MAG: acyltransferase [Bacteroidia bacterium]|nr:acyltransferase [Bacteroidia bacterium]